MSQNIYQHNGYADRAAYLTALADQYDIDPCIVELLADLLGPTEDFDGLVTTLQDMT